MASTSSSIRIRLEGDADGVRAAAAEAEAAIAGLQRAFTLGAVGMVAAGAAVGPILVGASVAFAGLAAAGLASTDAVKGAFSALGVDIKRQLAADAGVLSNTFVQVAGQVRAAFQDIRPALRDVFSAIGPQVSALTDGVLDLVRNAMPGLVDAAKAAGPAIEGLAGLLGDAGTAVSDFLTEVTAGAGSAGVIFNQLGGLLGDVLPVLGQLLAVASDFAAGALPVLVDGISAVTAVLSGLLDFLGPSAELLGTLAGAALLAVGAIKLFGGLAGVLSAFSAATALAGTRFGVFVAHLTGSFVAGGRAANVVTSLGRAIPVLGAAVIAAAFAFEQATGDVEGWAEGLIAGGNAAAKARDEFEQHNARFREGSVAGDLFRKSQADLNAEIERQIGLMGPLEAAQARAQLAQTAYNDAVASFGDGSSQASAAARDLAAATDTAEAAQRAAADATKSWQDRLIELTSTIQGSIDASLAYDQAVRAATDAEHAAAVAVRDHGAGSKEAQQANIELQIQYEAVAVAAGKKASADNAAQGEQAAAGAAADAYRLKLSELAGQQEGPGRTAALGLIARMTDSELAAFSAANATSGFATEVRTLPDGRKVTILADTAGARSEVEGLRRLASQTVTFLVQASTSASDRLVGILGGRRASGGEVLAGRTYLVGEQGPELLTLGRSGSVTPTGQIGGGDTTVIVKIGDQELRDLVRTEIRADGADTVRRVRAGAGVSW